MVRSSKNAASAAGARLILNEAAVLESLDHPNIVKSYGSGLAHYITPEKSGRPKDSDTIHYLALEYLSNGSLSDIVARGVLRDEFIFTTFYKLVLALAHVHKMGLAHRDIKPDNVMFDLNFNLKLIDFGLASPLDGETGNGLSYVLCGSKPYWAPELFLANYPYGYIPEKADIYALGVTLFFMKYRRCPNDCNLSWERILNFQSAQYWSNLDACTWIPTDYELQDLLRSMLTPNPFYRPSLHDILRHPWLAPVIGSLAF
jgi:serine/threonine protein kinase